MYQVLYEFDVFYPYEDMEITCKIDSITKIGIRGIIDNNEKRNPVVVFASRLHNQSFFENEDIEEDGENDTGKEGDHIKVRVIGSRFEINDNHITVLGKILK